MNICKLLKTTIFAGFVALVLSGTANAVTIGTFTPGLFMQSGTITNQNTSTLTGFTIDLGVDGGSAGNGTPVWDTSSGQTGSPTGTFSNPVPGFSDKFFTISYFGLNILNGNNFNYSGIDYDGFTGVVINGGGITALDGSEIITLFFANGTNVSANLPVGVPNPLAAILFDDRDLVGTVSTVPVPAALPLFGTGLAIMGFMGWRRKRKVS